MTPTLAQALDTLRTSQTVTLQGKPATWSNTLRVLLSVLMGLVVLLGIGSIVAIAFAVSAGAEVTVFTAAGALAVWAMLVVVAVWLRRSLRSQNEYREQEKFDVTLSAYGLTLRGVGPIPWTDFGPADRRMVPAERDSGYTRRAVMELTPSGSVHVNEGRNHRYIYVPGVEGLNQREVIQLINAGHDMFG